MGEELLQAEGWPHDLAEVDVWFCSDDEIRQLNRDYRRKDTPTDVLSFPQYAPGEKPSPGLPVALGDVVISVDTATRQAIDRGVSLATEITWLFAHSVLHLVGYDDDTEDGYREMLEKAGRVMHTPVPQQEK